MNRAITTIPDLSSRADRLTMSTRGRFGRALIDALRGRRHMSRRQLSDAVGDASHELRCGGLDDPAVLAFLGAVVEDTGRACGADRPSLLSGQLRWMPVRAQVLEAATFALAIPQVDS
ncbi:MAG TPA: hypothetical protein VN706_17725 [Gemmatimonadaceae bacterium]|nr:hypothetical protein [Gemmatimonadaceae bacterium]